LLLLLFEAPNHRSAEAPKHRSESPKRSTEAPKCLLLLPAPLEQEQDSRWHLELSCSSSRGTDKSKRHFGASVLWCFGASALWFCGALVLGASKRSKSRRGGGRRNHHGASWLTVTSSTGFLTIYLSVQCHNDATMIPQRFHMIPHWPARFVNLNGLLKACRPYGAPARDSSRLENSIILRIPHISRKLLRVTRIQILTLKRSVRLSQSPTEI
jgi:hypothetical protein